MRVLLEHGVDPNARKNNDTTPLHEAAQSWSVEAILVLLERGVDVNARKNDDSTPLHLSVQCGSVECTRVLLEHGANVGAEDGDGKTPFQATSNRAWDDEIMELLSEYGGR
jgi:cytohesin